MEFAIVAGTSSGALNAVTLAAAKTYPPDALKAMWTEIRTPKLPLPGPIEHYWALSGVPHMYSPRLDYWNFPTWTYVAENKPLEETLERLDWDQVRDWEHMRLSVSASDIENGKTTYFGNLPPEKLPGWSTRPCSSEWSMCWPAAAFREFPLDGDRGPVLLGRRPDR